MSNESGRALPNSRVRRVMLSIQTIMGQSGLYSLLRQAGLSRYVGALPPANLGTDLRAGEYAALLQAIENYYGRGARGMLLRLGYIAFDQLVNTSPLTSGLRRLFNYILPTALRARLTLNWLARELSFPGGKAVVHSSADGWRFEDHTSDGTFGRQRDYEICWVTQGEITEALKWATGIEYTVTEVRCRAKQDPACCFEIRKRLP